MESITEISKVFGGNEGFIKEKVGVALDETPLYY